MDRAKLAAAANALTTRSAPKLSADSDNVAVAAWLQRLDPHGRVCVYAADDSAWPTLESHLIEWAKAIALMMSVDEDEDEDDTTPDTAPDLRCR